MKRIRYFDIAKCIAIIAVIIGHTSGIPNILSRLVFTFHMPLFFICSGCFIKPEGNKRELIKKDAKGLLVPYYLTCAFMVVLAAVRAVIEKNDVWSTAKYWLLSSLYGSGTLVSPWAKNLGTGIIGAIWFLLALFVAKMIIYCMPKNENIAFFILVAIAYTGYVSSIYTWLPFSIQAGMTAAPFVYGGMLFKRHNIFEKYYDSHNVILWLLCLGIWAFCIIYCGRMYMVGNNYNNGILDVIGSVAATMTIILFSVFIDRHADRLTEMLCLIGRNTLAVLCVHILELNLFPWNTVYSHLGTFDVWYIHIILRLIVIAAGCTVLRFIPFINRYYFPQLRRKLNENKQGSVC